MKELPPKGEETFSTSRGLQDDALHALKIQSMGVTWHPVLAMLVDSGDLSNWPICFLKNVGKMGKPWFLGEKNGKKGEKLWFQVVGRWVF